MTDSAEFLKLTGQKSEDVPDIDLDNIDELLAQLTQEELDELNGDFDPDNSFLPPSERMRSQTTKDPTGPFSRKKLLAFLEKKAKDEKDWENIKQYVKKAPEKTWKAKEVPKTQEEKDIDTEWDDILTQATEDELVDLAAVLGFHGMLNQTQFYASENNEKLESGGFAGLAKAEQLKVAPFEPPNTTDVEQSIRLIKDNDSSLKHLNLNNIKNISYERLEAVCDGLKTNTQLETLEMASVAMTDRVAKRLSEALKENKTLTSLNIESNFVTGELIVEILKSINVNKTVTEFRATNQKPEALGNKVETKIIKLVQENDKMMKLGLAFEFPETRVKVTEKLQSNYDQVRKKRVSDKGEA
ncbi:tropomodulin-like isoform X2 [Mya arenaria]|uniref:tropomodulin-like isoform X2 n=1 Tax=Mya arenaria TaxID=6604 RepID=UPI0022E842A6|nr:tropomodulin-like isoform X2 [Mya arenaria]XP_052787027.1 tropomodulin-like isoform X2 [Mya arenaria]